MTRAPSRARMHPAILRLEWRANLLAGALRGPGPKLLAAIVAVGVPALYTVFPELSATAGVLPRALVATVWIPSILIVAIGPAEAGFERLRGTTSRAERERLAVHGHLLATLVDHPPGGLEAFVFTIYMFDHAEGRLVPAYVPTTGEPGPSYSLQEGSVGMAYSTGDAVCVSGSSPSPMVSLAAHERNFVTGGGAIVAVPLLNARDTVVAVLRGVAGDPPDGFTPDVRDDLERMSLYVGRTWIDLLALAGD